jgi:RNA polymerase sigma factor (sigma-70 family)
MSTNPTWEIPRGLGAEARWLQQLALRLTQNNADADDLTQDTLAVALSKPPPNAAGLRPWLAVIGRNLFLQHRRNRLRRARILATLPSADETAASGPAHDALERLELLKILATLIQALDEPYRETVVLRFLEGRTAAEIATAKGVPAGTIRWRLKVGLDRLRDGLDARHGGDRRRWAVLVLAPQDPPARPAAAAGTGLFWKILVVLSLAGAGVAALAVLALRGGGPGATRAGQSVSVARRGSVNGGPPALVAGLAAPPLATARLRGLVRDADGKLLGGAHLAIHPTRETIVATPLDQREGLVAYTASGPSGRFEFPAAPIGAYVLTASHADWAPAEADVRIDVGDGKPIEVALTRGGHLLSGTVSDRGSGAVAGAIVEVIQRAGVNVIGARFSSTSNDRGAYALRLPPGSWYASVNADGYVPGAGHVIVAGPRQLDFSLAIATRIDGQVVDGTGMAPSSTAGVLVEALEGAPFVRRTSTSAAGTFSVAGLEARRYKVTAWNDEGVVVATTATAAGAPSSLRLVLATGAAVTGRVLDDAGHALPGALVRLGASPNGLRFDRGAKADGEGRFRLPPVVPGIYDVVAESGERAPARQKVVVIGRDVPPLELRLPAGITVRGTVVDATGAPIRNVAVDGVVLELGSGSEHFIVAQRSTRTDDQGAFRLAGLAPGSLRVQVDAGERGQIQAMPMNVAAGEQRQLTLRLKASAAASAAGEADRRALAPPPSVRAIALGDAWKPNGSRPSDYDTGRDDRDQHGGAPTRFIARKPGAGPIEGFGGLLQKIDAGPYRGKRMRLSAEIRSEDVLQGGRLWMRVDGAKEPLAFDNMAEHPITGTTDWKRYQIVLDVAQPARTIVLGVTLGGPGRLSFRDVNLEAVDASVETTD